MDANMNTPVIVKAVSKNGCLLNNEELRFLPAARLNKDCFCHVGESGLHINSLVPLLRGKRPAAPSWI